jgi:TolB protein
MQYKKKIILSSILVLFLVTTACSQPVNLSDLLTSYRNMLQQVFEYVETPETEETDPEIYSQSDLEAVQEQVFVEETLTPPQIATEQVEKPPTPTMVSSPQGTIIYTCQVDKNPSHDQICMVNPDGSGFKQLTENMKVQHFYSSWSPDGKSFVFSGAESGEFKLYEMDLIGNFHIIGKISGELYAPMISPDGTRIVFTRHFSESEQYISTCDRDGSNVQNLTAYYDARDPVWSPDGTKILFTSLHGGTPQLYFMNTDGTTIQKITELTGIRGRTDWSVNLAVATYAGEKEKHNREIILLELGDEPIALTEGGDNLSPTFSPDGNWLAFMSYRDNFWQADGCELYVMRIDGSEIRRLTTNDYCDYQPRWGP